MSTKTPSAPAKPKPPTPLLVAKGFVPRNLGFVVRLNGTRMMDAAHFQRTINQLNRWIQGEFGVLSEATEAEVFARIADAYGYSVFDVREAEMSPVFYSLFNQSCRAAIPIQPGHLPLIKSWLGLAYDLVMNDAGKQIDEWGKLFNNLQDHKWEIAAVFGFKFNFLDWCLKQNEDEVENTPITATYSGSAAGNIVYHELSNILEQALPDDHPTP